MIDPFYGFSLLTTAPRHLFVRSLFVRPQTFDGDFNRRSGRLSPNRFAVSGQRNVVFRRHDHVVTFEGFGEDAVGCMEKRAIWIAQQIAEKDNFASVGR